MVIAWLQAPQAGRKPRTHRKTRDSQEKPRKPFISWVPFGQPILAQPILSEQATRLRARLRAGAPAWLGWWSPCPHSNLTGPSSPGTPRRASLTHGSVSEGDGTQCVALFLGQNVAGTFQVEICSCVAPCKTKLKRVLWLGFNLLARIITRASSEKKQSGYPNS